MDMNYVHIDDDHDVDDGDDGAKHTTYTLNPCHVDPLTTFATNKKRIPEGT